MEYLSFWGAGSPVFTRQVAPGSAYLSPRTTKLYEHGRLFCAQDQALMIVEGAAGVGKTTFIRELSHALSPGSHEVLLLTLVRTETGPGWLAGPLARFLGSAMDTPDPLLAAAARLEDLIQEQRKLVLMIDCAQRLEKASAFDEISALLDLQAHAGACVSFILGGNEGLSDLVDTVLSLAPRVGQRVKIPPLNREETSAYLSARLSAAGLDDPFEGEALDHLFEVTGGIPATVNLVAENALIEAWGRKSRKIDADIVRASASMVFGERQREAGKTRESSPKPLSGTSPEAPEETRARPIPLSDLTRDVPEPKEEHREARAVKPQRPGAKASKQKSPEQEAPRQSETQKDKGTGRQVVKVPSIKMNSLFKRDREDGGS